jgi:hypothetical protein
MEFQSILGRLVKCIKLNKIRLKMCNNASRKPRVIEKVMILVYWKVDHDFN